MSDWLNKPFCKVNLSFRQWKLLGMNRLKCSQTGWTILITKYWMQAAANCTGIPLREFLNNQKWVIVVINISPHYRSLHRRITYRAGLIEVDTNRLRVMLHTPLCNCSCSQARSRVSWASTLIPVHLTDLDNCDKQKREDETIVDRGDWSESLHKHKHLKAWRGSHKSH